MKAFRFYTADKGWRICTIVRPIKRGRHRGKFVVELAANGRKLKLRPEELTCTGCGLPLTGATLKKVPRGFVLERT